MKVLYLSIFFIFLSLLILGAIWGAIWLPTRKRDYKRIGRLVKFLPGMIFYDLGSGSGHLLFHFSRKYNIKCIGIEISPILYLYSKAKSIFYEKVEIRYGNLFNQNLSDADVIYCFLHPKMYGLLRERLKSIRNENLLIVLFAWPFENIKPLKIVQEEGETLKETLGNGDKRIP